MRCSAFANVRAHLRFVSRIGHNHALSMCALPTAVTRWASSRAWRASAGASAARAADAEPRTSSESTLAHAASSAASTSARRALPTGNSSSNFRSTCMSKYSASTSRCATASSARFRRYDGGPSKSGEQQGPRRRAERRERVRGGFDEHVDRLATGRGPSHHVLPMLGVQALHGAVVVPDQAFRAEPDAYSTEVDARHHLLARAIGPESPPGNGTRSCPTVRPTCRGSGRARTRAGARPPPRSARRARRARARRTARSRRISRA